MSINIPNIEELRQKTEASKKTKEKNLELAKNDVIELIKKNINFNITNSLAKGYDTARLFTWIKNDSDPSSYTFRGFSIYDIIHEGKIIDDLRRILNENKKKGQDDYYVGYYYFNHDEKKSKLKEGPSYIYMSWQKRDK